VYYYEKIHNAIIVVGKVEDTKREIIRRKSKERQYNDQNKKTIGQTMIYKTLHTKPKIG